MRRSPVGAVDALLPALHARARGGAVLAGFDFPIGLPQAYAANAGVRSFVELLPQLGRGRWSSFYELAADASEIGVTRPFYPLRAGRAKQAHLCGALGVTSMQDLLRACERGTPTRRAACSVFWTLGANQVGRAAVSGWRELLVPALAAERPRTALWPFQGALADLLESHDCVIAETYPAEGYAHLGLSADGKRWSKRDPEQRRLKGAILHAWAGAHGVELSRSLRRQIADGFGPGGAGEDAFDAVVGVLSMLSVVLGLRPDGAPDTAIVREVEGWILGQNGSSFRSSARSSIQIIATNAIAAEPPVMTTPR